MGLFGFGKKKEEKVACDCGGMCTPSEIAAKKAQQNECCEGVAAEKKGKQDSCCGDVSAESIAAAKAANAEGASVKVLGSGCAKCNQLEEATKEALSALGMDTEIDHVTDFSQIASYGVMSTPALVVDGKVVSYGKVLKPDEVTAILKKARA